ncbi:hypothetical protein [Kitasatospora cineracea]|uniref:Uncharacterized protein n=1 Tax=Kitasatospora cineracea TaxID=88074 RepID=A0A8G1X801_9ACTN|nr:hypothetical protein [Kitasatospora cineracea]ROR37247.1 hypothetical protein EDD39_5380 [Kitasatospora cineracea]
MTTENPSTDRANGTGTGSGAARGRFVSVPGTGTDTDTTRGLDPAPGTAPDPRPDRAGTDPRTDRTERAGTDRTDRTSTDRSDRTGIERAGGTAHPADLTKAAEPARPRSTAGNPAAANETDLLLPPELASRLTGRLDRAVGSFVDDPDLAVQEADEALDETVRVLTDRLQERRTELRDAWRTDGDRDTADAASRTEDLRLSLRAYRDLLHHLLAA